MPRHYKKKLKPWNEETVKIALQEVANGASVRSTALKYHMSVSMLRTRTLSIEEDYHDERGRKTALTAEREEKIKDALLRMDEMGFGPTMTEFQEIIHDYILTNNISTPFTNDRPGYEWAAGFMKRHKLTLKKSGTMQVARKNVTSDPFVIYGYYEVLQKEVDRLGIKDRPECIWNLDETGFPHDPSKCRTIGPVGKKTIKVVCGANRENTTVLAVCSADGKVLPPVIIFKGKHMQDIWRGTNALPGTQYAVSDNGWMTTQIFEDIFKSFVENTRETRPLLLILDGHVSHLSITTIELAKTENISILKLPAHCTDVLQPLDVTCFAPLKQYYEQALNNHVHSTGAREPLRKCGFVNMLSSVWEKGLSPQNVMKGFEATGVHPCDKTKYKVTRLNPLKLKTYEEWIKRGSPRNDEGDPVLDFPTDQPEQEAPGMNQDSTESRLCTSASSATPVASPNSALMDFVPAVSQPATHCSSTLTPHSKSPIPFPSPSTPLSANKWCNSNPVLSHYTGQELINILHALPLDQLVKEIQKRAPDRMRYNISLQTADEETTLEAIIQSRGKPRSEAPQKRRRVNMKARVITGEEIEKQMSEKKRPTQTKRLVSSGSDSPDSPDPLPDLDDSDSSSDADDQLTIYELPKIDDDAVNKYYAVFYSVPTNTYYWGRVTKVFSNDENEAVSSVEVDFLRKKNISSDPAKLTWIKPVQKDIQIVSTEYIFLVPPSQIY